MEEKFPIVIEIKLTAKDLWRFSLYHAYWGSKAVFPAIFSLAAVYLLVTSWDTSTVAYRIMFLVSALVFTVWQPLLLYLKSAKQAKNSRIRNGMTLSFDEEKILVSQGEESLSLEWENIRRGERIGDMTILYMDRIRAYLLPDDCLAEKKAEVTALIKEKLPPKRRKRI
ncbi:MAG: YcxB family protein [Lacrimispora sp.]|uniref:YcxB family protein n=1 Tax=Lacrimispora sp. TaxID=2719234 RepID=UPI0039E43EF7